MQLKPERFTHYRFFVSLVFLVLLLFMRYTLQINISKTAITLFVAFIALSGNKDEIIAIAMCCIPLHNAVDLYISISVCMCSYLIKNIKYIRVDSIVVPTVIMIIWELLHCLLHNFFIISFIASIIPLCFLTIIICVNTIDVNYIFIIRVMSIVTTMVCIIILSDLVIKANYNFIEAFKDMRRLGMMSSNSFDQNLVINPNSLGIICLLAIAALMQLSVNELNNKSDGLLILILLIFGILTASRTFLICFIMMFVLLCICMQKDIKKFYRFLISFIVLVILAILILINWFPNSIEYFIHRFEKDDITNGRDVLMRTFNNYFSNNLEKMFLGIGVNNFENKIINIYQISNGVPHNAIQEIILAWGILGLIMFFSLFVIIINKSRKVCKQQTLLNYIPLFIILLKSMAGQLLTSGYTMLALVFAYLSLCQDFNMTEKN